MIENQKIMHAIIWIAASALVLVGSAFAYEEHPNREADLKEQDRIFKLCQKVTEADKYEQKYIEKRDREAQEKKEAEKKKRIEERKKKNVKKNSAHDSKSTG